MVIQGMTIVVKHARKKKKHRCLLLFVFAALIEVVSLNSRKVPLEITYIINKQHYYWPLYQ
jgi:hypothetical protein